MRSHRIAREDGFTLMEILSVCAILGMLAAVALPTFIGQDQMAMDAEAKSNVRNLFTHVQSCFTEKEDYTLCDEDAEIGSPSGVAWGRGAGQVEIRRGGSRTTRTQVTIRGSSKAVTGGTRHRFTYIRRSGPPPDVRTCRSGDRNNAGACHDGSW